jgi:calcineurin-like phosphoesterase family protein
MTIFFTSDLHYHHKNVIRFCNRPYSSVEEMNKALIDNHNKVVGHDDTTYFLGDLFFCQMGEAISIMSRLNGKKRLILGNHDKVIRNNKLLQNQFEIIYQDLYQETIDGIHVVMCHYPLLSWNKASHGAFMLYGHAHNNIPFDPLYRRLDIGVDAQNYAPISWEEIKRKLEKVTPKDSRGRESGEY